MNLSNFAEQFAKGVLEKKYQRAVYPAITNSDYQGEIKGAGDRVNILSFLNSGELQDYTVGTDMSVQQLVDNEDQLVVEKRKAYNISLDRLEDLFTYATNIPDYLLNEQSMVLERTTDQYVLYKFGEETKAGNWIGTDILVKGTTELAGASGGTAASLVTAATGGTITLQTYDGTYESSNIGSVENRDGTIVFAGFSSADLYKGFRLRSTATFVTPWYRISAVTSSTVATVTEWDEATSGPDFEEGYTLRGLFGGDGINFPKYGSGDQPFTGYDYCGWELQAALATSVTSSTVYNQVTLLSESLDQGEVPSEDRHLTVPPQILTQLKQSSTMQPTGIAEFYSGVVINGTVGRVGGFVLHEAAGSRVSTRAGHPTASATTRIGADVVASTGATGYIIPANHIGFMTYADKWTESRVVNAENQFAKKYQGLYLFGAKVPHGRRKFASILFGSF